MAEIVLRVLDGSDRGRVFEALDTPVTIGREEGNTIQLNDDRVSRFHLKIQDDHDKIVLTDLESTNGTKVNGEDIQLRILRFGDLIALGRSVLLFGSRDQIVQRLTELKAMDPDAAAAIGDQSKAMKSSNSDFELNWGTADLRSTLHVLQPPDLPDHLSPGQAAQLSELLEYLHIRIREILATVTVGDGERVTLEAAKWQNLLDLQARLARYLRAIGEPEQD